MTSRARRFLKAHKQVRLGGTAPRGGAAARGAEATRIVRRMARTEARVEA